MRSIEILRSLTNLLAFCLLALSLPGCIFWLRYGVQIALLIAVVQVLMEGARWQMFPAYALAGLFFLLWLVQKSAVAGGVTEQILTHRLVSGPILTHWLLNPS